ncbi:L,D-transpeptidase family protein [Chitinophaga polysaccharea]|uniref:L,D-transpeptidase family protein n=1 Tax=Chitinophaga polysaccharea TaxID=1293035 RepID=UPI0014556CC9|nr:L,D-transpeptidase family protein [Chitinophaga polysaccharea]NLR61357.1 L,D-transpeptidase family protein [Chitinophaga polysaccharea]
MERQILKVLLACLIVAACKGPSSPGTSSSPESSQEEDTVSPRNRGITPANAYNDLFLDSMAVEKFIQQKRLDSHMANRLRSFYNTRNYEFAWLDSKGPTEQASAFQSLYSYSKDTGSSKAIDIRLDGLKTEDSLVITANNPEMTHLELQLTVRLVTYFRKRGGSVEQIEHMVPAQRYEVMQLADSMLKTNDHLFPAVAPMKAPLKAYMGYVRDGGWDTLPRVGKGYRKGQSSPDIRLIKKRLTLTGELADEDSSAVFDDALETAVNIFRNHYGYTENGVLNDTIIRELNVSAQARLQQLLINMERMKWMPAADKGKLILVNIPAFKLQVVEDRQQLFDIDIIVGKEGHSTTMFSGWLSQVVFSPYWNIPRSIIRKEILPAMNRRPGYLASKHMEITGHQNGLPVIRQLPGPHNALGRVKFLFPNSYNIYFHDTPEKSLFNHDIRTYSHGCIRLKDPMKMAQFVLENSPEWTTEKITAAMDSGKQTYVTVKHPVPVIITYFTAWVEGDTLHIAPDVYDHDIPFRNKLFL